MNVDLRFWITQILPYYGYRIIPLTCINRFSDCKFPPSEMFSDGIHCIIIHGEFYVRKDLKYVEVDCRLITGTMKTLFKDLLKGKSLGRNCVK